MNVLVQVVRSIFAPQRALIPDHEIVPAELIGLGPTPAFKFRPRPGRCAVCDRDFSPKLNRGPDGLCPLCRAENLIWKIKVAQRQAGQVPGGTKDK